jgi:hypothetical protein
VLIGCAWLLYYELPIGNEFTYFWGFFAMALILVVLGAIAGWLAAKAVKAGAPPTPDMAIEEARKIRETVSATPSGSSLAMGGSPSSTGGSGGGEPKAPTEPPRPPIPVPGPPPTPTASDSDLGRGVGDGTTYSG